MPHLTDLDRRIAKEYNRGTPAKEMRRIFAVSQTAIYKHLRKMWDHFPDMIGHRQRDSSLPQKPAPAARPHKVHLASVPDLVPADETLLSQLESELATLKMRAHRIEIAIAWLHAGRPEKEAVIALRSTADGWNAFILQTFPPSTRAG